MTDGAGAAGDETDTDAHRATASTTDPDGESRADGETDDGLDYAWVMQTTFVVTIVVGAPLVTLLSVPVDLPTWNARAEFAVRVGAVVWFLTAIAVAVYEKRYR
ncbi:DUF5822 domain-containing protein [Haloarchaeobius sp. HRN-SO-5]|uniref:DUF5822 domain-containing protein n=1 Tax=Haloarchaeobius sp. HRN-SO-5 TaxID=3446118 RepID=UPI003EBDBF26